MECLARTPATRRGFLSAIVTSGGAAALVACSPAAGPAQAPAASPSAPAASAAWEQDWKDLSAKAKTEGTLNVLTLTGPGYRLALDEFQKAFPEIKVEQQPFASVSLYEPKVMQERQAGIYSFDVAVISPSPGMMNMVNAGVFVPIRPLIFRPDVLDDKAWVNGYEWGYTDAKKQLSFCWEYDVIHAFAINTDLVSEGEVKSVKDLTNPKWKGKMIFADPRTGGSFLPMTAVRVNYGPDLVRQLLVDQEPVFSRDFRQIAEGLLRGRYPVAQYVGASVLTEFRAQGLGKNLKYLDFPDTDVLPNNSVLAFDRSPHPNAAKLFINWFLTKEGQTVWAKNIGRNTRRTDVPVFNEDGAPRKDRPYMALGKEEAFVEITKTQALLEEIVKIRG